MKKRLFLILTVLVILTFVVNTFASSLWTLPSGATGRLGFGKITGKVACSPASNAIAVPSLGNIWIYDALNGSVTTRLDSGWYGRWLICAAFSPDGTKVLTGDRSGNFKLHNASTGAVIRSFEGGWYTQSVAYSPDGTKVASGDNYGEIRIYNASTGKLLHTIYAYYDAVMGLSFSPDSSTLASCSGSSYGGGWDNEVSLWNVSTGANIYTLTGHESSIESVAFNKNGTK